MLLRFLAYCYQDDIIITKLNIEHILPKKYKDSFFDNISDEEIKTNVEFIGNKILFEKKLNIVAGNGYFGKKKEYYKKSNLKQVRDLSNLQVEDWRLENIRSRNDELFDLFVNKCEEWLK